MSFSIYNLNIMEIKTVLITGATSGIGKACACKFAKEGWNLILNARDTSKLENYYVLSSQNEEDLQVGVRDDVEEDENTGLCVAF